MYGLANKGITKQCDLWLLVGQQASFTVLNCDAYSNTHTLTN